MLRREKKRSARSAKNVRKRKLNNVRRRPSQERVDLDQLNFGVGSPEIWVGRTLGGKVLIIVLFGTIIFGFCDLYLCMSEQFCWLRFVLGRVYISYLQCI